MYYNIDKFYYKDYINQMIPKLRDEFIQVQSMDTSSVLIDEETPYYDLNFYTKWKVIILKEKGIWNDINADRFPILKDMAVTIGDKCRSIAYSILEPGGILGPYANNIDQFDEYFQVHAPIVVPVGDCGFLENGIEDKWVEGECLIFNVESEHSVWNNSKTTRVVAIFEILKEGTYED